MPTVPICVVVRENTGAPVTAASTMIKAEVRALRDPALAVRATEVVAALVGVPVQSPVVATRVKPVGMVAADHVGAALVAAK